MFEGCDGRVCDAWSLQSSNCSLPSFVCCLSCLLNMQLRRCLLITFKVEEAVSMTSERRASKICSGRRPGCAVWLR